MSHSLTRHVFGLIILVSGIAVIGCSVEAQDAGKSAVKTSLGSDDSANQTKKLKPTSLRLANDEKSGATRQPLRPSDSQTKIAARPTIKLVSAPQQTIGGQEEGSNSFSPRPSGYTPTPITQPLMPKTSQEQATSVSSEMASYIDLKDAIVNFMDVILLPAQEAGVIKSLDVKEGDSIPAGKIVGMIDDELAQRILEQSTLKFGMASEAANDTTAIQAATKKYKVAGIEAKKTTELWTKGSKSDSEKLMADYQKDIAWLEIERANREQQKALAERKMAAAEVYQTKTRIERHTLKSDFAGNVVEIMKKPQEYVQPGDSVMRIGRMDRLWVQGTLDVTDVNPHEVINKPVTVTVKLARNETATFEGKITNVSIERSAGQRYMVKAEVENRWNVDHWVMQPLGSATIRIHLDGGPAASNAASNPGVNR